MNKKNFIALLFLLLVKDSNPHSESDDYEDQPTICRYIIQARYQQDKIIRLKGYLVQRPSAINEDYNDYPILLHAIYWKSWPALAALFELHIDPTSTVKIDFSKRGSRGDTILHALVACNAPFDLVHDFLFQNKSLIHTLNDDSETGLELLLKVRDNPQMVATLIEHGSIIHQRSLDYAQKYKRTGSLCLLNWTLESEEEEHRRNDPQYPEFWERERSQSSASNSDYDLSWDSFDDLPRTML
jgi:hypothetical protein